MHWKICITARNNGAIIDQIRSSWFTNFILNYTDFLSNGTSSPICDEAFRNKKKKPRVIRTVWWTLYEQFTLYVERSVWHYYRIIPLNNANNPLLGTILCQNHPISISLRSILLSHSPPPARPYRWMSSKRFTHGRPARQIILAKHPALAALQTAPP